MEPVEAAGGPAATQAAAFKKILIVDDIIYVVRSITKILKDEGYFILTATTGKEALEKFEKYSPDLVTIDQKLPDMTGRQLVERILGLAGQRPKIIFISSVYEKDEIREILKGGVDDYLLKPFQKAKLIETVKRLL